VHQLTFAPPAVRDAYAAAGDSFVDLVRAVPPDGWREPGLGVWTIQELVGHTCRAFVTLSTYLRDGQGLDVTIENPFDYFDVLASGYGDQNAVAERGRAAGAELGDDPLLRVIELRDAAVAALRDADDDAPVATPIGVMRLVDYLPSRVVELTVHSGDVAAAIGVRFVPDRSAAEIVFACLGHVAAGRDDVSDAMRALAGRRPLPEGFSLF
jgi:uncharacterized protein (TIGR03083 family)